MAVDLIGFGRTRAPERVATLQTNRDLVLTLLEQTGPATVFGNSMGGVIATGVTARRPDLVEALVLVNPALPWGRIPPSSWLRAARYMPVMMQSLGRRTVSARARMLGPERLVDLSLGVTLHDPERLDPDLRRRIVLLAAERYAYPEAAAAYADAARTLLQEVAGDFDADLAARGVRSADPPAARRGGPARERRLRPRRRGAPRHPRPLRPRRASATHPQLEEPEWFVDTVAAFLDDTETALPTGRRDATPSGERPGNGRMGPRDGSELEGSMADTDTWGGVRRRPPRRARPRLRHRADPGPRRAPAARGHAPGPEPRSSATPPLEAQAVAAGVIAADGHPSDAELAAFAEALAPWFESLRGATPASLRDSAAIRAAPGLRGDPVATVRDDRRLRRARAHARTRGATTTLPCASPTRPARSTRPRRARSSSRSTRSGR